MGLQGVKLIIAVMANNILYNTITASYNAITKIFMDGIL